MKRFFFFLIIASSNLFAQTDWQKWEAKSVSYELPAKLNSDEESSSSNTLFSPLKNVYSFLISNYDGDNCPFSPSCSNFFVEAINQTNIFSGLLMFADRFTRDMNLLKDKSQYSLTKSGKYFDPPANYNLKENLVMLKLEK